MLFGGVPRDPLLGGGGKPRTAQVRFQHHNLDLSEVAPGLVVMAHTRHTGAAKAFLQNKYGASSACIRVFDLEPNWVSGGYCCGCAYRSSPTTVLRGKLCTADRVA